MLGSSHGGLIGSLSWAALHMLATAMVDVRRATRRGAARRVLLLGGENPLALYLLHPGVLGFVGLPAARSWYADASVPLAAVQLLALEPVGVRSPLGVLSPRTGQAGPRRSA